MLVINNYSNILKIIRYDVIDAVTEAVLGYTRQLYVPSIVLYNEASTIRKENKALKIIIIE